MALSVTPEGVVTGSGLASANSREQREQSIGGNHDARIAICSLRQTIADRVVVARILNEHVDGRLEQAVGRSNVPAAIETRSPQSGSKTG